MRLPVQEPTLAICKLLVRSSSSLYTSNKEDGKTPPCLTSLRMSKHQNSILTHTCFQIASILSQQMSQRVNRMLRFIRLAECIAQIEQAYIIIIIITCTVYSQSSDLQQNLHRCSKTPNPFVKSGYVFSGVCSRVSLYQSVYLSVSLFALQLTSHCTIKAI